MKTQSINIKISEPELLNSIIRKAKREGFGEHEIHFWLKLYLVRKWKLDEKKFLQEKRNHNKITKQKQREAGIRNLQSYNLRRK